MISSQISSNFPPSAGQPPKYPMLPPFSEFSSLSRKISSYFSSESSKKTIPLGWDGNLNAQPNPPGALVQGKIKEICKDLGDIDIGSSFITVYVTP